MMWSCILVWLGAKKSVTNAKWANLFPFFTMSTSSCLTLSRQLFKVGIFFRTGLSPVFQIDFFLKFQTSICQRGNHEATQVENISIFPLPAAFKHHFLCYILFFAKQRKCHLHTKLLFLFLLCFHSRFVYAQVRKKSLFFVTLSSIVFSSLFLISYDLQT